MRKRRKNPRIHIIILLMIAIIVDIIIIVYDNNPSIASDSTKITTKLYFLDSAGKQSKTLSVLINRGTPDEEIEQALDKLWAGPQSTKFSASIPKNVKLLSFSHDTEQRIVTVNVSSDFSSLKNSEQVNCRVSIVQTLSEFDFVEGVVVLADGEAIAKQGPENSNDIVNEPVSPEPKTDEITVELFFVKSDESGLAREEHTVKINPNHNTEKYVIEQLIAGPLSNLMIGTIPTDTKVLNAETGDDGVCNINFSKEFYKTSTNTSNSTISLMIYSIVDTLVELELSGKDIKKVQFLMDGDKATSIGDTDLSAPLGFLDLE